MSLKLTSGAFNNGGRIPEKYSKKGGNISPPLEWDGASSKAVSLALIVDDPDAPSGTFVHWLLYGIPPSLTSLKEEMPNTPELPSGLRQGRNGFGDIGYGGPQPPSGVHRYFFHLYALDRQVDLPSGAGRSELERAIEGHIIDQSELMGRYEHNESSRAA
jgi:Raf kinase inhibitor-like YbhB/YbcL family protein